MAAPQRDRSASSDGSAQRENDERRGEGRGRRDRNNDRRDRGRGNDDKYIERVVTINRVSKVVKGGRRFTFTALVVVGDGEGTVGVGYGKAKEVPSAIAKAVEIAKKNFFHVPMIRRTIPHLVQGEDSAGVVLLRPASPGTGVIAGGPPSSSWSSPRPSRPAVACPWRTSPRSPCCGPAPRARPTSALRLRSRRPRRPLKEWVRDG